MPRSKNARAEKPVSLHPLSPEEALRALLQVKAPPDARSQKTAKNRKSVKRKRKRAPRKKSG